MDFFNLAKRRYSVRAFSDRPVEREKLDLILEAANAAPTAKNLQPQRIYVARSEEAIAKLAELSPCLYGAKTVLVFAYDGEAAWHNPLEEGICAGVEDVSIAATHAMLEAAELGLGTCWVNYFANAQVAKALELPETQKVVLLLPVGYPAEGAHPGPNHGQRKPLSDTVTFL